MSYEIIYDKQFIKVSEDTFIPMILAGCSNLWEHNGNRETRVRNWFNFAYILNGSLTGSKENMLKRQEEFRASKLEQNPEEYNDKSFGYFTGMSNGGGGCNMTYGQYTGIVKTGCKKALTIEQLINENVRVCIFTSTSTESEKEIKSLGLEGVRFTPNSTEELEAFLRDVAPKYSEITLNVEFSGMFKDKPKRIRKKYFSLPKKVKTEVESKVGFAIESPNGGYFYVGTRNGYRYSPSKRGGKQFLNKKDAERKAKLLSKKHGKEFKIVDVEYEYGKTFYV